MPDLLKVNDVVKIVGISRSTFFNLQRQGLGPTRVLVGQSPRFRLEDVNEWIDGLQQPAATHS